MIKLNIPYRSQWNQEDADEHSADCGPTCLAMVMNYYQIPMTPNGVYRFLPPKNKKDYTSIGELMSAGRAKKITLDYKRYASRGEALQKLRDNMNAGKPMIALIKYEPWRAKTGNQFKWGHFVVITGYDNGNITFHDPIFGLWQPVSGGAHFIMTENEFCNGWGGFPVRENPNWACVVVEDTGGAVPSGPQPEQPAEPEQPPTPEPERPPQPERPPKPEPEVTPTPPATEPNTMTDINKRVRALAAYRWAVAPDLDNAQEMQLWLDNLGDWGLHYDEYVVQPGDSWTRLAERFFGDQRRWHTFEEYNDATGRSLWAGITLLVPKMGEDGTYENPALPKDTAPYSKDIDSIIAASAGADDYNDIGPSTFGVGFLD